PGDFVVDDVEPDAGLLAVTGEGELPDPTAARTAVATNNTPSKPTPATALPLRPSHSPMTSMMEHRRVLGSYGQAKQGSHARSSRNGTSACSLPGVVLPARWGVLGRRLPHEPAGRDWFALRFRPVRVGNQPGELPAYQLGVGEPIEDRDTEPNAQPERGLGEVPRQAVALGDVAPTIDLHCGVTRLHRAVSRSSCLTVHRGAADGTFAALVRMQSDRNVPLGDNPKGRAKNGANLLLAGPPNVGVH